VWTISLLDPTDAERAEASTALIKVLPSAEPWSVGTLVDEL
jgi:hypothetical protein